MIEEKDIKRIIGNRKEYRNLVFQRGYLITTSNITLSQDFLLAEWRKVQSGEFAFWCHPNTSFYLRPTGKITFFLIGHAYNPSTGCYMEDGILEELSIAYNRGCNEYQEYIDSLTGIYLLGFITDTDIHFQLDPVAMSATYYGIVGGNLFITSHCNLVAHICKLTRNSFVDELVSYKYYKFFGAGLPGALSPFEELNRVQSNFEYTCNKNTISFRRVFPHGKKPNRTYSENIDIISGVLEKNMELILKKWGKECALGLTGGKDSTTSLAGAHKLINEINTFSYISCKGEQIDAEAAAKIAEAVGVKHVIYPIELTDDELKECDDIGSIIEFNMGSIGRIKDKEIRKRVYFIHHKFFKTEIKSWVDEIGRARLHKRYIKKQFPRSIRARYLTTTYKFFLNRKLVSKTDKVFSDFLKQYYTPEVFKIIPWWDLLYWEYTWGASEALHLVNEHMLTANVTIPYNNRKLLEAMLDVDLPRRITDSIQIDVIEKLLPAINRTGISVKDYGWNRKREIAERVYWDINTILPF